MTYFVISILLGIAIGGIIPIANTFSHYRIAPIMSTSMGSSVPWGSLIVAKKVPVSKVELRDIIYIDNANNNKSTLGRVTTHQNEGQGYYSFTLKEDANTLPNPYQYTLKSGTYKLSIIVPVAGFVVYFLSLPLITIIWGVLSFMLALTAVYKYRKPVPVYVTDTQLNNEEDEFDSILYLEQLFQEQNNDSEGE